MSNTAKSARIKWAIGSTKRSPIDTRKHRSAGTSLLCVMADKPKNSVKMIGPKGKISHVSRKAAKSTHLANLGFMVAPNQTQPKPKTDAGKA